jgi:hypothetical protein
MYRGFNLSYQIIAKSAMEPHGGQGTRYLSNLTKLQSPSNKLRN